MTVLLKRIPFSPRRGFSVTSSRAPPHLPPAIVYRCRGPAALSISAAYDLLRHRDRVFRIFIRNVIFHRRVSTLTRGRRSTTTLNLSSSVYSIARRSSFRRLRNNDFRDTSSLIFEFRLLNRTACLLNMIG